MSNDNFDWLVNSGPTSSSQTGPEDDVPGGGNYIYIETSGSQCRNGREAIVVSQCIDVLANPDSCDMSFDYIMYGVHVNELSLEVTTDGGMTWQELWHAKGNQGNAWKKKFIDLDSLNGLTVQFRFVGKGGSDFKADIALDNILFYGSELAAGPDFQPFVYYRDEDGDGFGDPNNFITTCELINPVSLGYVAEGNDCNDLDFESYPGALETPCDDYDNNCNGDIDEFFLLPVATLGDTVCNGETGTLFAQSFFGGEIFWYDAQTGGNPVHLGAVFSPDDLPLNHSAQPLELTFYAEEITPDSCVSLQRQPAILVIMPTPELHTADAPAGCTGVPFDLATLDITDQHGVNGMLTWFDDNWQAIPSLVSPDSSGFYHLTSATQQGCSDTLSIFYTVKPGPVAQIQGDTTLCRGKSAILVAYDANGSPADSLTFLWDYNDQTNDSIHITNNMPLGQSVNYTVTITRTNGCSDTGSMLVQSVTSINSVQVTTLPESGCDSGDGQITLNPVGGMAPYHYQWTGGGGSTLNGGLTLPGLARGAYAFTITDSGAEGCAFVVPVVVVDGPSTVTTIQNIKPVSCHEGNDGCIEINVIGTAPSILWSNGATTEQVCGLVGGTYKVTITDGNCENILTIPLPEPAEPVFAKPNVHEVSCFGKNDGSIDLTVFGGTAPYQFLWSNGFQTQNIGNLAAGVFAVTITDARGCEFVMENLNVIQPDPISLDTLLLQPPFCNGMQNGELAVGVQGGTLPYSLAWSNGASGSELTNLSKGNYSVTVTDVQGCKFNQSILIPEPPPAWITIDAITEPSCNGLSNGSINITATGGNGGYSFLWNNNSTVEDITNVGSGEYQVTVTDILGCTAVSGTIEVQGKEFMAAQFTLVDPPCVGKNEGAAAVTGVLNGTAPFHYYWSTPNSDSVAMISGLGSGDYTVTIVDANGCRFDSTVTLAVPQHISAIIDAFNLTCYGNASGRLELTATNGAAPYDVRWSTGQHGNSISGLQAGYYTATVTDGIGCKFYTDSIFLDQPEPLLAQVEYMENNVCHGGAEGDIQISVSGGTVPYTYQWSDGQTSEDASGLAEGAYAFSVTDVNGCVASGQAVITSPDPLQAAYDEPSPGDCLPFEQDTACISVSGGIAPYQYLWSSGDQTSCLTDPLPGDYHVTVTDVLGCTTEVMSVKILEEFLPVKVTPLPLGKYDVCPETNDGSVAVVIEHGIGPYQFIWSNSENGPVNLDTIWLENLAPGKYNVTITDNVGCTAVSDSMAVTTNGHVLVSIPGEQVEHVKCKSGADGSIQLNVDGGLPPYSYCWTTGPDDCFSDALLVDNLAAGFYSVLVTDQSGCTGTAGVEILEPATYLGLTGPPVVRNVSCFGGSDGKIEINPVGGVTPYSFLWSNGATQEDPGELTPDVYGFTITDANNCGYILQGLEVNAPDAPLSLMQADITPPSCYGSSDGYIDIEVTGGTMPYTYTWDMPSADEDLLNVPAGNYRLIVVDSNILCKLDTVLHIPQPDSLTVNIQVVPPSPGQNDGTIIAVAKGGVLPYSYYWNTGQTGDTLTGLALDDYELTVVDGNFCSQTVWVTLMTSVHGAENLAFAKFLLYPNPNDGRFRLDVQAAIVSDLEVMVFNPLGQTVFSKNTEKMKEGTLYVDLGSQPPGLYLVVALMDGQVAYSAKVIVL